MHHFTTFVKSIDFILLIDYIYHMNLRDLQYLHAVAHTRHFGRAAQQCNVSQPTLSMQLKKLEDYLGVTLFERTQKQVLITPIGEAILARADTILNEAKAIRQLAKNASDPLAGDFRLGAFPTLAPYLLPTAVPLIHDALPNLRLLLVEEKTGDLLTALKAGRIDAALLALPLDTSGFETTPLFADPFMLAVPLNHALAKRKSVTIDDVAREPLLLLDEGHCLRAQALELCHISGGDEQQEFRATSLETLRQMVASGIGVTLIPKLAMKQGDGIRYIPFKENNVSRTIGLVWRKQTSRSEAIKQMAETIRRLGKQQ